MSFKQQRLVLRSNQSASNVGSIAFTSVIDSNFSVYMLKIRDLVPITDATSLRLTFSTDNGSTYLNSVYRYGGTFSDSSAATGNSGQSGSAAFLQLVSSVSNVSSRGVSLDIILYDLNSSTLVPKVVGTGICFSSSARIFHQEMGGQNDGTTPITAIKLAMNSGNISSGTFRFYGVNES